MNHYHNHADFNWNKMKISILGSGLSGIAAAKLGKYIIPQLFKEMVLKAFIRLISMIKIMVLQLVEIIQNQKKTKQIKPLQKMAAKLGA